MNLDYYEESSIFSIQFDLFGWAMKWIPDYICVHYSCTLISSKVKMLIYLVSCLEFYLWSVLSFAWCPVLSFCLCWILPIASRICFVIKIRYNISLLSLIRFLKGYLCVVDSPSVAYTLVWCFFFWVSKRMKGTAIKWHKALPFSRIKLLLHFSPDKRLFME